jgi:DNA primase large subunit
MMIFARSRTFNPKTPEDILELHRSSMKLEPLNMTQSPLITLAFFSWEDMLSSLFDMSKYPFSKETQEYRMLRQDYIAEEDLIKPEFTILADRAKSRILQSLEKGIVDSRPDMDPEIEVWSFSVAMYLVTTIGDSYLRRRYALAEAKRVYELLRIDQREKVFEIAVGTFNWNLRKDLPVFGEQYDFALHFVNYLSNALNFQDDKWKLVNRLLTNSYVFLTQDETARLLEEEVRKFIESRLVDTGAINETPSAVLTDEIRRRLALVRNRVAYEELPKIAVVEAYPPCIRQLHDHVIAGQHLSHLGRFALTTFLFNIGVSVDEIVKLFANQSDFNEKMTRYQVEHIAGSKGSKTKYKPPNCDTLRTHGLCLLRVEECRNMKNPLVYYKRKARAFG